MAELYSVGKKASRETVEEILAGLEAMGTYIPTSEDVRREYRNVLLKEYEEFIEVHPSTDGVYGLAKYASEILKKRNEK